MCGGTRMRRPRPGGVFRPAPLRFRERVSADDGRTGGERDTGDAPATNVTVAPFAPLYRNGTIDNGKV